MTRKSKPRRTCKICKHYKYMGNNDERRPARDLRRLQDDRLIRRKSGREGRDHRTAPDL